MKQQVLLFELMIAIILFSFQTQTTTSLEGVQ